MKGDVQDDYNINMPPNRVIQSHGEPSLPNGIQVDILPDPKFQGHLQPQASVNRFSNVPSRFTNEGFMDDETDPLPEKDMINMQKLSTLGVDAKSIGSIFLKYHD